MTLMERGSYNRLPHYIVVGNPSDFYIWVNEDGRGEASNWIKGKEAFEAYNTLRKIYKNKKEWVYFIKNLWSINRKTTNQRINE